MSLARCVAQTSVRGEVADEGIVHELNLDLIDLIHPEINTPESPKPGLLGSRPQ
jgi:hypothetical protein